MRRKILTVISAALLVFMCGVSAFAMGGTDDQNALNQKKPKTVDKDLVIQISDIKEFIDFYPVEADGMQIEIMVVKAPDGSIRTAFNTCHYCYQRNNDPKALGYFMQIPGPKLVSLCGTERMYTMDKIQLSSDACHPEPLTAENRTVTASTLTITKEYFLKAKAMFAVMKTMGEKGSCCD
ncbi:MAG: DUF2318 domain-containing protein [Treponema sp.]|nr:DUF2318 domain-containing protein [Treponema sp.]